ncbi:YciI family protein [Mycobacterium sp. 21AC1]|uniref:YciI family protein n=1 Tax=[Mycobacterium] appelbergii TaxID=2939269 RepID=UPI0029392AD9|nr:YciI family protein [Mycobacterium sp. 21AC1]MDV3129940.1 YciI family protein [Mycobacterium sp. 21AC1]
MSAENPMSDARMPWEQLRRTGQEMGLLALKLYVISSKPVAGLGPILDLLEPHVAYQTQLERDGVMFAAGPLANDDSSEWLGEGLFMYRAESIDQAREIAQADPMHRNGAREFTVREWMLNEGTCSVQVYFSADIKPRIS